jgi:hypothetical protein
VSELVFKGVATGSKAEVELMTRSLGRFFRTTLSASSPNCPPTSGTAT